MAEAALESGPAASRGSSPEVESLTPLTPADLTPAEQTPPSHTDCAQATWRATGKRRGADTAGTSLALREGPGAFLLSDGVLPGPPQGGET
jgi:hypothetical protein